MASDVCSFSSPPPAPLLHSSFPFPSVCVCVLASLGEIKTRKQYKNMSAVGKSPWLISQRFLLSRQCSELDKQGPTEGLLMLMKGFPIERVSLEPFLISSQIMQAIWDAQLTHIILAFLHCYTLSSFSVSSLGGVSGYSETIRRQIVRQFKAVQFTGT